ncbi:hypothetical protein CEXT_113881 [Caerostris extrusa]|uniref:Uncharacterized protein n=1 Tax=Caerostris extrusa TaxID=172846 RepID=A0AAV4RDC3_CAEEX|nr:hypothetical protein CEXT_113881 [Caerostris extrusa]
MTLRPFSICVVNHPVRFRLFIAERNGGLPQPAPPGRSQLPLGLVHRPPETKCSLLQVQEGLAHGDRRLLHARQPTLLPVHYQQNPALHPRLAHGTVGDFPAYR